MAVLAWVLLVALVILGFGFVAIPLRRGRHTARRDEVREALLEKESALQLLRDLEYDRRTGKLVEEDYLAVREEAETRAIEAMKRCDRLGGAEGDDPIERAIRAEKLRIEKGARA